MGVAAVWDRVIWGGGVSKGESASEGGMEMRERGSKGRGREVTSWEARGRDRETRVGERWDCEVHGGCAVGKQERERESVCVRGWDLV